MRIRLKKEAKLIWNVLKKHGFYIVSIKGDHIKINRDPPLERPIILVNKKELSFGVKLNILRESGLSKKDFKGLF